MVPVWPMRWDVGRHNCKADRMKYPIVTVDFETEATPENSITHPPKPVGVSIKWPGQAPNYFAWEHPCENNCTAENAMEALDQVYDSGAPILFLNSGFDISVWSTLTCDSAFAFRMGNFDWRRIHELMYLIFFRDPYSPNLQLKPNAVRWLGMPSTEQDELYDWIVKNVPGATKSTAGQYICKAPGKLTGRYANGDTIRTESLYQLLYDYVVQNGMLIAYERERRLFPICLAATRRGIPVDYLTLCNDEHVYTNALQDARKRIGKILDCPPEVMDSDETFADALERAGAVTEWVLTEKDRKRSLAADNLKIVNPELKTLYEYYAAVEKTVTTYMRPWIQFAAQDHRVHTIWNQVRQSKGEYKSKGARTGRLSSDTPALMNVTTKFENKDGSPMAVPPGLPPFPIMRRYCKPEKGHVWLKRDVSSQEVRILAHFENGALAEAYRGNPALDPHMTAKDMIRAVVGMMLSRFAAKTTGLSVIYGTGGPGLAKNLHVTKTEAYAIKDAYLITFPGVKELMDDVQKRGRAGIPIKTWGGRLYLAEPSKEHKNPDGSTYYQQFYYKLLNYLIQGSAADQTKDIICEWDEGRHYDDVFLLTVHDEADISAELGRWKKAMAWLKECMDRDRFDVPMRSEGLKGPNWHDLVEVD